MDHKTVLLLTGGLSIAGAIFIVVKSSLNKSQRHVKSQLAAENIPSRLEQSVVVTSVDCHCGGLPARVVIGGGPCTSNARSAYERREIVMRSNHKVKLLLTEPRGYPCQNVDLVYPKTETHPDAEYSYVICENNSIFPLMSGHNTICVVTALLEMNMVEMKEPITRFKLEAPSGIINIKATCKNNKVEQVTFRNCPSFVEKLDVVVNVPVIGSVVVDIAFGGMWYCIVDLRQPFNKENPHLAKLKLIPQHGGDIVRLGEMIKVACREQHPVNHPTLKYPGCDILAFRSEPSAAKAHAKNAVVMSTGVLDWGRPSSWKGNIDRSPCGTGTCAIMSTLFARGKLALNEDFIHESVMGSIFTGRVVQETEAGLICEISGSAYITQLTKVCLDPTDPFPQGFTCGDIWA